MPRVLWTHSIPWKHVVPHHRPCRVRVWHGFVCMCMGEGGGGLRWCEHVSVDTECLSMCFVSPALPPRCHFFVLCTLSTPMLLLVGCFGGGCVCSLGPAFELAITASSTPVDTEVTLFRTKLHRCRICSTVQAPVVAGKLTGGWYKAGGPAVVDSQDAEGALTVR